MRPGPDPLRPVASRAASGEIREDFASQAGVRAGRLPPEADARAPRAFTLVEVLLVLALLALFATLLVPGVNSMLSAMNDRGPEQQLSEAILAARGEALETGRTVDLRYDPEKRQLVWGAGGKRADPLPLGAALELLPMEAGGNILLGGQLAEAQDPLRRVRFFPDGTCDSFRIRLKELENAHPRVFVIDPWTCSLNPLAAKR